MNPVYILSGEIRLLLLLHYMLIIILSNNEQKALEVIRLSGRVEW
jgi:hypothetical protein